MAGLQWDATGMRAYRDPIRPQKRRGRMTWENGVAKALFARITPYPKTGKWHVFTCDFDTTNIVCASYQAARATVEALFACE